MSDATKGQVLPANNEGTWTLRLQLHPLYELNSGMFGTKAQVEHMFQSVLDTQKAQAHPIKLHAIIGGDLVVVGCIAGASMERLS